VFNTIETGTQRWPIAIHPVMEPRDCGAARPHECKWQQPVHETAQASTDHAHRKARSARQMLQVSFADSGGMIGEPGADPLHGCRLRAWVPEICSTFRRIWLFVKQIF
jgi:hypothetical protein